VQAQILEKEKEYRKAKSLQSPQQPYDGHLFPKRDSSGKRNYSPKRNSNGKEDINPNSDYKDKKDLTKKSFTSVKDPSPKRSYQDHRDSSGKRDSRSTSRDSTDHPEAKNKYLDSKDQRDRTQDYSRSRYHNRHQPYPSTSNLNISSISGGDAHYKTSAIHDIKGGPATITRRTRSPRNTSNSNDYQARRGRSSRTSRTVAHEDTNTKEMYHQKTNNKKDIANSNSTSEEKSDKPKEIHFIENNRPTPSQLARQENYPLPPQEVISIDDTPEEEESNIMETDKNLDDVSLYEDDEEEEEEDNPEGEEEEDDRIHLQDPKTVKELNQDFHKGEPSKVPAAISYPPAALHVTVPPPMNISIDNNPNLASLTPNNSTSTNSQNLPDCRIKLDKIRANKINSKPTIVYPPNNINNQNLLDARIYLDKLRTNQHTTDTPATLTADQEEALDLVSQMAEEELLRTAEPLFKSPLAKQDPKKKPTRRAPSKTPRIASKTPRRSYNKKQEAQTASNNITIDHDQGETSKDAQASRKESPSHSTPANPDDSNHQTSGQ